MRFDGGWNWLRTVPSGMNGDAFWVFSTTVLAVKALAETLCKQLISCCILLCKSPQILFIYSLYIYIYIYIYKPVYYST
jgi:hypothetical protein